MTQEEMKIELEELAVRFSEGWHEGIKIDASDIMLLNKVAQALAQPEQEPVAWTLADKVRQDLDRQSCPDAFMRIAVESIVKHHPPQRTEQPAQRTEPLTNEEIDALLGPFPRYASEWDEKDFYQFARAAHGIKEDT